MLLLVALLFIAAALVTTGLAMWSIPLALVAAGVLLGAAALFVDIDPKKTRRGGRS